MSQLQFEFEWIDPAEAQGAELRATWAQLRLLVDGRPITRLIDDASRSVRSHICLPLYPVAEWLATHWWSLLHEVESTRKLEHGDYSRRHCLRQAGEGFALPALWVIPSGLLVGLKWAPTRLPMQRVEFAGEGFAYIGADEFKRSVSSFIDTVIRRLEAAGILGTLLQEEWLTISGASRDESEFCAAAASLGLEPYSLEEPQERSILDAAGSLPPTVRDEFFSIADVSKLPKQTQYLGRVLERARSNSADLASLKDLKSRFEQMRVGSQMRPWDEGYEFARKLRSHLHLDGKPLPSLSAISEALSTPSEDLQGAIHEFEQADLFDAAVDLNQKRSPGFAVAHGHASSIRFALCRALYEYLSESERAASLVTGARSDRQKRNRAFAAEFLAPVSGLRHAVKSKMLGAEEIDELAEQFGVSPIVIGHQLENHGLARLDLESH